MKSRLGVVAILAAAFLGLASARGPPVDAPADACQACLVSVRILEDFLCDPAATDFLVDFVEKQICPAMGDMAQCHNLAEGLLPTIIQWFRASATPASLCSSAGVCGAALQDIPMLNRPALRVRDTAECAMCKYVVRQVQTAFNNSDTLEEIKQVALKVCGELPDELSTSCFDFVNNYEPLVSELVEDLDAGTVCGLVGACMEAMVAVPPPPLPADLMRALANTQMLRRPPPPPLFGILAAIGMPPPFGPHHGPMMGGPMMGGRGMGMGQRPEGDGQREGDGSQVEGSRGGEGWSMASMMAAMMAPGGPMGPANDACDYCKMAVMEAHSLVGNPTIQAEVINYTKAICDNFPSFAEPCKSYVDMYAPLVFSLLEEYLVPDTLCAQTGMCPPPPALLDELLQQQHPRGFMCRLMDGWLGDVLRKIGLGALLPHHDRPNGDPHDQVHYSIA